MTTSLPAANQKSSRQIAPADRETHNLIAEMKNRLEPGPIGGFSIADRRLPSAEQRAALSQRRDLLVASLLPGERPGMARAVAAMFTGFPSVRMDAEEAKTTTAMYVSCVAHLPLWAVEQGCRAAVERKSPFPPSSGEFKAFCEAAAKEARDERTDLEAILNADVYRVPPADERERIKRGFCELLRDLGWNERDAIPASMVERAMEGQPDDCDKPLPALSEAALRTVKGA